ncbi:MAG: hypothetical protein KGR19_08120 [Acidobacteria bacterium]|nr:hypothetical protein [Acidobacteriota bacterium]
MDISRKAFLPVLLVAATAALVGCGSSTLNDQEREGLTRQAVTLQDQLAKAGDKATACATPEKIKKEGAQGVGTCLGNALDSSSQQVTKVSDYVKELAGNASGDCQSKLEDFAGALDGTANTLGDASAIAKKGEIDKIGKELQGISENQVDVQVAGREADKACGG